MIRFIGHLLIPLAACITGDENYFDSPLVNPSITHGMVIDAGSGGSRLHVFNWKPRIFNTLPPPISYPEANEKWTARNDPGIATYADNTEEVANHLGPLIDFAKLTLSGYEHEFEFFPIYFKATGGMRELELKKREELIRKVQLFLSDKTKCPFYFRDDFARVISGEEEAIFSWAATNFLMGSLLPAYQGVGTAFPLNNTYGTLDLGGSSTQIAFYVPSQDISEGLFKLQIGSQKHWNVYTKSFLQFGIVSARKRYLNHLVDKIHNQSSTIGTNPPGVMTNCFHMGYSEKINGIDVMGPSTSSFGSNQLNKCRNELKPLMEKQSGKLCSIVYHGDCSIAGAYQPPIPRDKHGHFIGTSSYKYPWNFLMLPKTATLDEFEKKAGVICQMNYQQINNYFSMNSLSMGSDKLSEFLQYYCFLSSYVLVLLLDGYGFHKNQTLTVIDEINGHKVGWALGAILFEINTLPWVLDEPAVIFNQFGLLFCVALLGFIVGIVVSILIHRQFVNKGSRYSFSSKSDTESESYLNGSEMDNTSSFDGLVREPDRRTQIQMNDGNRLSSYYNSSATWIGMLSSLWEKITFNQHKYSKIPEMNNNRV